tara:strand:- start:156 stop:383 length:228 start_codon:yes stop_codon:yes gene_type:complete
MKVGDLVKLRSMHRRQEQRAGLIVELIDKKCWRTDVMGKKVDWNKVDPEPHAVVLVGEKYLTIPVTDLELIREDR